MSFASKGGRLRPRTGSRSSPTLTYYPDFKNAETIMSETLGRRARILIADDETEIRDVLYDLLTPVYECASVNSAEEALARLRGNDYDLVISDIMMSGMSGLEMIPHVLRAAPDVVVIMISGVQTVESAIEALRAGAFDYIMKPFDIQHVEAAVARALEHHSLRLAKRRYESYLEEMVAQRTAELDKTLHSLEDAYRTTLKALTAALETRDAETHGHSERVVNFSLRLGVELGLAERAGLAQDGVGHADLPDVVEQRAELQRAQLLAVEPQLAPQPEAEADDPLGVAARLRVARFERRRQRPERRAVGVFERAHGAAELGRPLLDHLFEVRLVAALGETQRAVFEGAADGRLDVLDVERLHHVVEGAGPQRLDGALDRLDAADHDDHRVGREAARVRDHFEPRHAAHHDVADDQVEFVVT